MPKTVLVTGAAGFIGSAALAELNAAGYVARPHSRTDSDLVASPLKSERVDHVIHLAGRSFVPDSWADPKAFYEANVLGTVNCLEFCRRHNAALTFVSSYVYGTPIRLPIDEQHPRAALSPYAHSKIVAEDVVQYYTSAFGVRAIILRPFNIYGSGQGRQFLIPTLIAQVLDPNRDHIEVRDLRPKRDFLHVRDLGRLLISTVAEPFPGVYNVGSGFSISVADLVDVLTRISGRHKPVRVVGEPRRDEVFDVVADISHARQQWGWTPQISLEDGLREMLTAARPAAPPPL